MNVRIELISETLGFDGKRRYWNASYSTTIPSDIDFDTATELIYEIKNKVFPETFSFDNRERDLFKLSCISKDENSQSYSFGIKNSKGGIDGAMELLSKKPKEITLELKL